MEVPIFCLLVIAQKRLMNSGGLKKVLPLVWI